MKRTPKIRRRTAAHLSKLCIFPFDYLCPIDVKSFDVKLFDTTPIHKLYHNFLEYMDIEDKFDVKSTFFFRTQYENGDYTDYQNDINDLIRGGWEIGLHTDPSSINNIEKIKKEKNDLEKLTKSNFSLFFTLEYSIVSKTKTNLPFISSKYPGLV